MATTLCSTFLHGKPVETPAGYAALEIAPRRLLEGDSVATRRALLEYVVAEYLRGRRLYLVSEPGLTALLTWGLARLLPPQLAETLTFSTYESVENLPQCKLDIVNTVFETRETFDHSVRESAAYGQLLHTYHPLTAQLKRINVLRRGICRVCGR